MTAYFVDTSALAKRYLNETGSNWVRRLMHPSSGHTHVVSELLRVEMASLFSYHQRQSLLLPRYINRLESAFLRHYLSEYMVIPVTTSVLISASNITKRHPLRSLDAIQLASAVQATSLVSSPITFISADNRLLTGAAAEGFKVDNPLNYP